MAVVDEVVGNRCWIVHTEVNIRVRYSLHGHSSYSIASWRRVGSWMQQKEGWCKRRPTRLSCIITLNPKPCCEKSHVRFSKHQTTPDRLSPN